MLVLGIPTMEHVIRIDYLEAVRNFMKIIVEGKGGEEDRRKFGQSQCRLRRTWLM